jgi:hypothetical protein
MYFQQFDARLVYATDLGATAHYYRQHDRLMQRWMASFGEAIFIVDYDELVRSPGRTLSRISALELRACQCEYIACESSASEASPI